MSNTSETNVSRGNDLSLSNTPPYMAEGIALCVAFTSTFVLNVPGNLITIIIFANKNIHKNHFSLVVNMAFADLLLGAVSLPIFTWPCRLRIPAVDQVDWNGEDQHTSLHFFPDLWYFDTGLAYFCSLHILWDISRHILAGKTNIIDTSIRNCYFTVWILALLISATWTASNLLLSYKRTMFIWGPYTLIPVLITCGCNLGIWKKFQRGTVASAQQQTRDLQNKRLTDTLSSVSGLVPSSSIKLLDNSPASSGTMEILFYD